VLILLAVAAFAGGGLYFVEQAHVDRFRNVFADRAKWQEVRDVGAKFRVRLPANNQPIQELFHPFNVQGHRATVPSSKVLVAGSTIDPNRAKPEQAAFDLFKRAVLDATGGTEVGAEAAVRNGAFPGREWTIRLRDKVTVRRVRAFRAHDRVYYVAAEGPHLTAKDPDAAAFFDSFRIDPDDKN
jgi:hypothetical protein